MSVEPGRRGDEAIDCSVVAQRGEFNLPTQVDLLTQERDQLKAELARERDNAHG